VRSVEFYRVQIHWKLGERIFNEEQGGKKRAEYGIYLMKSLAKELEPQLGTGFSWRQLARSRQFYREYPIVSALRSQSLVGRPGDKGGHFKFERLFYDLEQRLLGDSSAYCTTFYDFYGLPEDFPGKREADSLNTTSQKAHHMKEVLVERVTLRLGGDAVRRFIPSSS